MTTIDRAGASVHHDLTARHAARLDACWGCVRVESVQVARDAAGHRARALVQLSGLAPADVRVEVMPLRSGVVRVPGNPDERRMVSSHALGNGCFVFEATIPHHDDAPSQEWLVHVHPAEAFEEPRVEYRFRCEP